MSRVLLALALALFGLGCALDCGVRTYEEKGRDCAKDAGSWKQVQDCLHAVDCEYGRPECGR